MRIVTIVLSLVLCCALPALAADGVPLPGTQPTTGPAAEGFPRFSNGAFPGRFDRPQTCRACHGRYHAPDEQPYEPWETWAGSMMAQSARDPLFWAALDIANQDDRERLGGVGIGDFCLRCHVPVGWYEGRARCETPWGESFDGACLKGPPTRQGNDFEGISCHVCHRAHDASAPPPGHPVDPDAPYLENGQLYLGNDPRTMEGPYSDAEPPSRHGFRPSAFIKSADFCGQCHDITHPVLERRDPESGAGMGALFPIERTYSEWKQSDFADESGPHAARCQDCHMPAPDFDGDGTIDDAFACNNPPGPRGLHTALEGPVHTHQLRGASSFMLELMAGEFGDALRRRDELEAGRDAALKLLREESASIELLAPPAMPSGAPVPTLVRVTNRAGHKLPTGYAEGRRAWLEVRAGRDLDADGTLDDAELLFRSGAYDSETGYLAHDAQLRTYEVEHGVYDDATGGCRVHDDEERPLFHFAVNDCIARDSRIPPRGFVPTPDTAPVGHDFAELPGGVLAHWDEALYLMPVAAPRSTVLIEATLWFQSVSGEYVDFLVRHNRSTCDPLDAGCDPTQPNAGPNRSEKFRALWERYGRSAPVALATGRAAVTITSSQVLPLRPFDPERDLLLLQPGGRMGGSGGRRGGQGAQSNAGSADAGAGLHGPDGRAAGHRGRLGVR